MTRVVVALLLATVLVGQAFDDLSLLTDEFDDANALSQWQRVYQAEGWGFDQLETWDINTTRPGHMIMMPHSSTWFQEWRGVQAFKPVTGDFVVTTDVQPRNRAGDGPPGSQFSLAGIMVRAPRPDISGPSDWTAGGENYVFLSAGAANTAGAYQFEVKTTEDSVSVLEITGGAPRVRIQVARIGAHVITLRQLDGGTWQVHRRYTRTDFPDTLNVGLTTYTDWPTCSQVGFSFHNNNLLTNGLALPVGGTLTTNPDLVAAFDYLRYARPQVPPAVAGLNLSNPAEVNDATLLSFLGAHANTPGGSILPSRIVSPVYVPGSGFEMTLELEVGRSYRVQATDSLSTPNWTTRTNLISTTNRVSFTDPFGGLPSTRVYRVVSP